MLTLTEKLEKYKDKTPEIVFEWSDSMTDAKGWVVINSLRNGAAGGGTRMRKGLNKEEVTSLAKVMEIKFSVCGPPIGGAKSGIDFDPRDPRRTEVLERWYQAVFPILKNYYGTGGDLNVDELKDVIPITEDLGLWHPQEGIVNGHLKSTKGDKINLIGQLRYGCSKIVEDARYSPVDRVKLAVADLITGWGVSESINHFYSSFKSEDVSGKKVIVQGWGNVASAAAYYLSKSGAIIVGIIDRAGGVLAPEGLSQKQVEDLFVLKDGNKIAAVDGVDLLSFDEVNSKIWDLEADIFVPGAASKLITADQVDRMMANGLSVISCGANVPFADDGVFFGETADRVDDQISVIPDFLANCGMARVFAYLMEDSATLTDDAIFQDVSKTIGDFFSSLRIKESSVKSLTKRSLEMCIDKLI